MSNYRSIVLPSSVNLPAWSHQEDGKIYAWCKYGKRYHAHSIGEDGARGAHCGVCKQKTGHVYEQKNGHGYASYNLVFVGEMPPVLKKDKSNKNPVGPASLGYPEEFTLYPITGEYIYRNYFLYEIDFSYKYSSSRGLDWFQQRSKWRKVAHWIRLAPENELKIFLDKSKLNAKNILKSYCFSSGDMNVYSALKDWETIMKRSPKNSISAILLILEDFSDKYPQELRDVCPLEIPFSNEEMLEHIQGVEKVVNLNQ